MNFTYLERQKEFSALYTACREAEEFALTKPDISAISARKAMEFIVKYIYTGFEPYPPYGCTVYDMIRDTRFQDQFADPTMLDSIDLIRRSGNAAVHGGKLIADEAMQILQHLHFLVGEFSIGIGLIRDYPAFVKPELNLLREMLGRIHSDNFSLNIIPYLRASGHEQWANALLAANKVHPADFSDLPDSVNCDAFWEYFQRFEHSIKSEIETILELLPLTTATQKEWDNRRTNTPKAFIDKIECYVMAYIADNQNPFTKTYTYYVQALGDKAFPYLWLMHPDYVPESMRDAYVKPEAEATTDEYIPFEVAIKQLLRYFVAGNPMKRNMLARVDWCKTNLSLPMAAILSMGKSSRPPYSKDAVHMGDRKHFVLLEWNKAALMRLRQLTGELGETLITLDRLADWGLAEPGSEAEKRAKERAEKRKILAQSQSEVTPKETKPEETAKPRRKYTKTAALPENEASPIEIRDFLISNNLTKWLQHLTSAEWCKVKFGSEHPLLISFEDRQHLLKKQNQRGETPSLYSRALCEHGGKTYYVKRMKLDEFESMKNTFQSLQD